MELQLLRGFGEVLSWDVQIVGSVHSNREPLNPERAYAGAVSAGLLARWDVLRLIPFAALGISWVELSGVPELRSSLGLPMRVGVEYLWSRRWRVSAQLSGHVLVQSDHTGLDWGQVTVGFGPAWGW